MSFTQYFKDNPKELRKSFPRMTTIIPESQRTDIPIKQLAFLLLDCREALFGGAAGGGKTQALLMAALQYVDVPTYRALILRRTYQSLWLAGAIGERSHEWLRNTGARWNGQLKTWTFPSGASLQFGYLAKERDADGYLSSAYQFIGFDELTEIREKHYEALITRLRRLQGSRVPLRVRSATNPGGSGHDWVHRRFILKPGKRAFVPATIKDNHHLDVGEYVKTLKDLPRRMRDRFLHGDWDALDDGLLDYELMLKSASDSCLWPEGHMGGAPTIYIGVDLGRSRDLTVVWVWEQIGNRFITRKKIELFNTPWTRQAEIIAQECRRPGVRKCKIDRGAIGAMLAEVLCLQFPGICEAVGLNEHNMGAIATKFRLLMESGRVVIPDEEIVFQDFRLVRQVSGHGSAPKMDTNRDESGHADRFWAAALGLMDVELEELERVASLPRVFRSQYDPPRPLLPGRGLPSVRRPY
jgi:hypothetical protein